jgi:hypothetical protein
MASINTWHKRRREIQHRVGTSDGYARCIVADCDQPTMAKQRSGLNRNYCKRHVEHYRRHGSYSKRSYTASQLGPYRKGAAELLMAFSGRPEMAEAVDRVRTLYWRGGRKEEAFRLAGKSPEVRSRYAWARLREDGVAPDVLIAAVLAVVMCARQDNQPERRPEYVEVQVGKAIHRMAGGSHKRWERERPDGSVEVTELHKYPASRGLVLRHLGRAALKACEPVSRLLE